MSVQILHDPELEQAAMYCNTTDFAFGPTFDSGDCWADWPEEWQQKDAAEIARAFLRWHDGDNVRTLSDSDLVDRQDAFFEAVENGEVAA